MKSRLLGAVSACFIAIVSQAAQAVAISGQGTWETTLKGRDLDGNPTTHEAYYDAVLDITWLADANMAASNAFGLAYNTNLGMHPDDNIPETYNNVISANGTMSYGAALHWIDAMNADGGTGYMGYNDWRLPTMLDTGISGCNYSRTGGTDCGYNVQTGSAASTVYSEMASLFYDTLGNLGWYDTAGNPAQPGWGLSNTSLFSNLHSHAYWSGLESAPSLYNAWIFGFNVGSQNAVNKKTNYYALAVRPGDVSAVPVPAAAWLFGSGLVALLGVACRKR